jgi:Zn-dependent protease
MNSPPSIPYLINFGDLARMNIDDFVAFILGALLAVLINAEAQAFTATLLGDDRPNLKDRFHYNAFLHLDLLGSLAFLLGGFGWPRQIDVDKSKFAFPRLFYLITRFSGVVGNILLAGIGGSVADILRMALDHDPRIFTGVIGVNITVAVYNLIPIPPLAAGSLLEVLLPQNNAALKKWLPILGGLVILVVLGYERFYQTSILGGFLNPWVTSLFNFIKT